jgi:YVTN family beta-propeller protein
MARSLVRTLVCLVLVGLLLLFPTGVMVRGAHAATSPCSNCVVEKIPLNEEVTTDTSIVYDPSGNELVVPYFGLQEVNGSTDTAAAWVAQEVLFSGAVFDPQNGLLYAENAAYGESGSNLTVVGDGGSQVVGTLANDGLRSGTFYEMAYDPVRGYVDVASYDHALLAVNGSTDTIAFTGPSNVEMEMIADSPAGVIYGALPPPTSFRSFNVSIVDGGNGTLEERLNFPGNPIAIVYDPQNGMMYVSVFPPSYPEPGPGSGSLDAINTSDNRAAGVISVPGAPQGVAYDPANGELYVSDTIGANVSVIDPTTGDVVASIPTDPFPQSLAYDNADRCLYVLTSTTPDDPYADEVSVIQPPGASCPSPPPAPGLPWIVLLGVTAIGVLLLGMAVAVVVELVVIPKRRRRKCEARAPSAEAAKADTTDSVEPKTGPK